MTEEEFLALKIGDEIEVRIGSTWWPAIVTNNTKEFASIRYVDCEASTRIGHTTIPLIRKRVPYMYNVWKLLGLCPSCGHRGEWVIMALKCPLHGTFMGGVK